MMPSATNALTFLAAATLLFAGLHDLALRTIPNWVSVSLVTIGVLLRILDHQFVAGISYGAGIFVLATACWRRGMLGGGDVKLLAATSVLVSPSLMPTYLATVALAGGALALLYLCLERILPNVRLSMPASLLWRITVVECRRIRRRISLPYATAISAAALLMLAKG